MCPCQKNLEIFRSKLFDLWRMSSADNVPLSRFQDIEDWQGVTGDLLASLGMEWDHASDGYVFGAVPSREADTCGPPGVSRDS